MAEYRIVNMVASAKLNRTIDLFAVAMTLDNVEYEPEQFPGAILKLEKPRAVLLFKTGSMIIAGAKNEEEIRDALRKVKELLAQVDPEIAKIKEIPYRIENMVASAKLNRTIDLFAVAMTLDNVEYEPEQFPGAILKLDDPRVAVLLFKTGNIIVAGARNEEQIKKAVEKVQELLEQV